jgi:Tfp pilus assembly PilM family ATPase
MPGFENHIGFNISSSKLQVVEVNFSGDQYKLVNVDETYFNDQIDFENDKETKISALLQGAFDELLIKKNFKSSSASFTLPFELFHTMQMPYDTTLLYQDLLDEFKWELSVLYPFISTKNLVLQYFEIEKGPFNETSSALVFAIQRRFLQMLDSFCKKNNLKLKFIDNLHIAAERSLSVSNAIVYKGLTLSVYFNNKFLSLFYAFNGKPLYFKVIPLNDAGEITNYLLKETSHSSILNVKREQIEAAFISGDEITGAIVQTLKKTLGLDFTLFNPFDKIRPVSDLYESKLYLEKYNSFASAAGIAFRIA